MENGNQLPDILGSAKVDLKDELINNDLQKLQDQVDSLSEKIDNMTYEIGLLVAYTKEIKTVLNRKSEDQPQRKTLVDALPADEDLDKFEENEGTFRDYSRVADEELSEKELKPFVETKTNSSLSKSMYNACPTEADYKDMDYNFDQNQMHSALSNSQDEVGAHEMAAYIKNV